jgi:hypothetical protein
MILTENMATYDSSHLLNVIFVGKFRKLAEFCIPPNYYLLAAQKLA